MVRGGWCAREELTPLGLEAQLGAPADVVPAPAESQVRYHSACGTTPLSLERYATMQNTPSLTFERSSTEHESHLKIQVAGCEMNVWFAPGEIEKLRGLGTASWDERRAIRAGVAAGAPVFWSSDHDEVTVLVGEDDETWDIAMSFVGVGALLHQLGIA